MKHIHLLHGFLPVFVAKSRTRHLTSFGPIIFLPHDYTKAMLKRRTDAVENFYVSTLLTTIIIILLTL